MTTALRQEIAIRDDYTCQICRFYVQSATEKNLTTKKFFYVINVP